MKTGELIDLFIRDVCAGKSNETPKAYRSKLQHLSTYMGESKITQNGIDKFRRYLLERSTKRIGGKDVKGALSRFTIRSVLATTIHFLRWAGEHGYIAPGFRLVNIREPNPDPKAIDPGTVDKLLAAARTTGPDWERARNTALIYLLRDTGGRVGSITRIDLDNLDLVNGYATAMDKGDQLSWLWFNPPTAQAIREWLEYRDQLHPADYRLLTGARGQGLSRQGIYRVLGKLAKIGKVHGRYNPHSFRHAFARDSLLAGADLGQVSQMMNHHSVVVTHKYYLRWHKKELKQFHKRYSPGRLLPPVKGSAKP